MLIQDVKTGHLINVNDQVGKLRISKKTHVLALKKEVHEQAEILSENETEIGVILEEKPTKKRNRK